MNSYRATVIGSFAAAMLLSGCANLRPDIHKEPTRSELQQAGSAMYTGPDNGSLVEYHRYADELAAWHQKKADELFTENALLSELGFVGTVVAVLAGATEHLRVARRAAVVAGGSGLVAERYSVKVQAGNYERAADAFLCIRDQLAAAKTDEDQTTHKDVRRSHPDLHLSAIVRDSVLDVLRKLRKAQRDITIAAPDIQKIKDALGIGSVGSKDVNPPSTPNIDDLAKNLAACAATF